MRRGRLWGSLVLACLLSTGCSAPLIGPPAAHDILAKPSKSGIKDAHAAVKGHFASGGFAAEITGEGLVIFRPKTAMHLRLQGQLGALPFGLEIISVDGKDYQRLGTQKWTQENAKKPADPEGWQRATDPRLLGEETLPQGKTWHVKSKDQSGNDFDLWVRQTDGYPLKYASGSSDGSFTLIFDKFNTGATVKAPPPSEIQPAARNVRGRVGEAMQLNAARVTVVSANLNAPPADRYSKPKPGNRFVVVEILYENTGNEKVSYNPFDWKLSDGAGFSYDDTFGGREPTLHFGEISPAEKARGFITFEVPEAATGLVLKSKLGDDTMTIALS